MIVAAHIKRWLTIMCMLNAMWADNFPRQLTIVFRPKAMQAGCAQHRLSCLCKQKAMGSIND